MHDATPQGAVTPLGVNLLSGKYQVTRPMKFHVSHLPSQPFTVFLGDKYQSVLFNERNPFCIIENWKTGALYRFLCICTQDLTLGMLYIYNDTNPKVFAVVDLVSAVKYLNHDRKQFNSPSAEGTLAVIII